LRSVICNFFTRSLIHLCVFIEPANRSKPATCASVNRPITNYDRATSRSNLRRVRSHATVIALVWQIGIHAMGPFKELRAERARGGNAALLKEPARVRMSHCLAICEAPFGASYFSSSPQWLLLKSFVTMLQDCDIRCYRHHYSFRSTASESFQLYVSVVKIYSTPPKTSSFYIN